MIIPNRDRDRHLDHSRILSEQSASVQDERTRIRTYIHVPVPNRSNRDNRVGPIPHRGLYLNACDRV